MPELRSKLDRCEHDWFGLRQNLDQLEVNNIRQL